MWYLEIKLCVKEAIGSLIACLIFAAMESLPRVAVVILSWNGKEYLREFLPSVLRSDYKNLEIIVADNASNDKSIEFLQKHFPSVRIIQNKENLGFAAGYNAALKEVEADYYVLLNQDVAVDPAWIEPVVEAMEHHPEIAAAQPKIRSYERPEYFEYAGAAGGMMDRLAFTFCRGRIFDEVEHDKGQYDDPAEVFWASGAAFFVRAEIWHRFGGLDADLFAHMEEIDFCWRVKNAGYSVMAVPQGVVYHLGGGSLPMGHPRKTYLNFRNNLIIILKNETPGRVAQRYFFRLVVDGIAVLRSLATGQIADARAIGRAHLHMHRHFGKYLKSRKKAQRQTEANRIGPRNECGRYRGLIIYDYFIKKKKYFSQLASNRFRCQREKP